MVFFLTKDSRKVESETVDDWMSDWLLQDIKKYDLCDIHNADNTGLFLSVQASKTFYFLWRPLPQWNKNRKAGYSAPCM